MLCAEFENVWRELLNFWMAYLRGTSWDLTFGVPTKDDEYSTNWRNNTVVVITRDTVMKAIYKEIKNQTFWVALSLKKTWSVISKLFLLNCIFHYVSNWSKVLEFYLTSFFNMKSWRVKFRNFLGDFPVHYAALFINRIN